MNELDLKFLVWLTFVLMILVAAVGLYALLEDRINKIATAYACAQFITVISHAYFCWRYEKLIKENKKK